MRLIAFSDAHGDIGLVRLVREKSVQADVVVCCGDFTPRVGTSQSIVKEMGKIRNRLLIVLGNAETPEEIGNLAREYGWTDIHGGVVDVEGVVFAGCGGSGITPFNTAFEMQEEEIERLLARFKDLKDFILVSHSPPEGGCRYRHNQPHRVEGRQEICREDSAHSMHLWPRPRMRGSRRDCRRY